MSSQGVTFTAAVIISLLAVMSCSGGGEAAPLFGAAALFSSLIGSGGFGTAGINGTSGLGLLALTHVQHKIDTLGQIADLLSLSGNVTESFFVK